MRQTRGQNLCGPAHSVRVLLEASRHRRHVQSQHSTCSCASVQHGVKFRAKLRACGTHSNEEAGSTARRQIRCIIYNMLRIHSQRYIVLVCFAMCVAMEPNRNNDNHDNNRRFVRRNDHHSRAPSSSSSTIINMMACMRCNRCAKVQATILLAQRFQKSALQNSACVYLANCKFAPAAAELRAANVGWHARFPIPIGRQKSTIWVRITIQLRGVYFTEACAYVVYCTLPIIAFA